MCLAAWALAPHPRLALVLAANRDEFHERPSLPLAPWALPSGGTAYAGRDERAGGTWLGLSASGRLALLTNVRRTTTVAPQAPSRGQLPTAWLDSHEPAPTFWPRWATQGHAPFNLLMADLAHAQWHWGSNVGGLKDGPVLAALPPEARRWGLSNAALDTPWPKLVALKTALGDALARHANAPEAPNLPALCDALWHALADRTRAPDADLPDTGFGLARERMLSSIFIDDERGVYGTRCATVVLVERLPNGGLRPQVHERRFAPGGAVLGTTVLTLPVFSPATLR